MCLLYQGCGKQGQATVKIKSLRVGVRTHLHRLHHLGSAVLYLLRGMR